MPAFLPWLLTAFFGGAKWVVGSLAAQVLIGLGIGVATYTGMDISMDYAKQQAINSFGGLPGEVIGALGYAKVGSFISLIFSAMAMRLTMTTVRNSAGLLAAKSFFKA